MADCELPVATTRATICYRRTEQSFAKAVKTPEDDAHSEKESEEPTFVGRESRKYESGVKKL